jgi:hypothetical protein
MEPARRQAEARQVHVNTVRSSFTYPAWWGLKQFHTDGVRGVRDGAKGLLALRRPG